MPFDAHANFALSAVATAPTPADTGTSLIVAAGTGARFPAAPFQATIWPTGVAPLGTNAEIVTVTAVVVDTLTIVRQTEPGGISRSIVVGDQISAPITADTIRRIEQAIPSTAGLISAVNVSAGASSANLSALTFSNSGGVSFGLSAGTVTGSVETNYQAPGAYLTTAALSQDSSKYAGTNGAITGGSITVDTSGVSIDLPAYLTTAQPVGAYLTTARASNDAIGLNTAKSNVTWTVNSSGLSLDARGYAGTGTSATNASLTLNSNGLAISVADPPTGNVSVQGSTGDISFSNSNNVSFGFNASTITASASFSQTVQTQHLHDVTLAGNTAGVLALVSSGTMTIAGGNNITVSQAGNAFTISGANAAGAQTGISGLAADGGTITSGTASFSNLNGVSFGIDGQTITASVETNYQSVGAYLTTAALSQDSSKYAGTNGAITGGSITVDTSGVSVALPAYLTTADLSANSSKYVQEWALTGNTAGTTSSAQGTRLYFSGGNSITISGSSNTLVFSVGNYLTTQSGQAFSADASSTFQTLVFQDSNGVSWSNNAGSLRVTHGLQFTSATSAITSAALHTSASRVFNIVAATDNTGGGTASLSSDVSFSAANGLTFYTSAGNAIVGSHNAITTARRSTDAIGLNTAQTNVTWTVNSSGLSLNAGGYAGTVTGATGASLTVNTSGVSINLPAYLTTADLSANSSKYVQEWALTGNTAGTTSSAQGTRLYFSGGNSITISGSSNSLVFSVGNYLTTARASTDAVGLNTAKTNVTWTVNSSGLSIDAGGYAGTVTGATGASLTVNSSGVSVNLPAYLTTADLSANSSKYVQEWALTGNTAGTTSSAQGTRLYFSGGNSITISGSSNSLVFSVGNYLTTARASTDAIGLNTAKTNVTWTANSSGLSLDAGGYAGTVTGATGASLTVNSSGVSVNLPAYLTTADLSANSSKYVQEWALTGNTAGTTSSAQGTRLYFSGGANLTISGSSNSLVFAVAAPGAAVEANWVTLQGNVVGSSSASGTTIAWSGGNGVTLSGTNNSIIGIAVSTYDTVGTATTVNSVASANSVGTVTRWAAEDHRHAGVGGIGISTSGNTSGTTGSVLGTYWIQGGNNITASQITSNNGSHTLVLSGAGLPLSYWRNAAAEIINGTASFSVSGSTSYIQPMVLDKDLSASYIRILHSFAVTNTTSIATTANATGSCSILSTFFAMLYTRGTGASSQSLQSYASGSASMLQMWSLSASGGASGSQWTMTQSVVHPVTGAQSTFTTGVTTSLTNYSLGSLSLTRFTGLQHLDIPFAQSLSAGNYWLAFGISSSSAIGGSGAAFTQLRISGSNIGVTQINSALAELGQVSANSMGLMNGLGSVSTNAIGTTASLGFTNITTSASHPLIPLQFIRIT